MCKYGNHSGHCLIWRTIQMQYFCSKFVNLDREHLKVDCVDPVCSGLS